MKDIPTLTVTHLSEAQLRAYAIADNRLAELATWDKATLSLELVELDLDFDLSATGFTHAEIDLSVQPELEASDASDVIPPIPETEEIVTRVGDLWQLGDHKILCANTCDRGAVRRLMANERAQMVFTDPPFNVPIVGHASGLGKRQHKSFAMAVGEMSVEEFTCFLETALAAAAAVSAPGSLHYVCIDWRHMGELITAGNRVYDEIKNLCVWNKTNGGMGSFYRSKHELVFVFKYGKAAHVNNIELGRFGRYRSNVWEYAGANTFRRGRKADLNDHPTVKPVLMIADAIRDASHRGDIVFDGFGGAGTTLLAAEQTGRKARLVEIAPQYVDVTIKRWQTLTGGQAVELTSGAGFDTPAGGRLAHDALPTASSKRSGQ